MLGAALIAALTGAAEFNPMVLATKMRTMESTNNMTLQKALFPEKSFRNEKMLKAYLDHLPAGLISSFIGGDPKISALTAGYYQNNYVGKWRERIPFTEDDLEAAFDPVNPTSLLGFRTLVAQAMENINVKIDNRMEWLAAQAAIYGTYTDDLQGPVTWNIPDIFRLDLNDAAADNYTDVRDLPTQYLWTPAALWSDLGTANIIQDFEKINLLITALTGHKVEEYYVPAFVRQYITGNADIKQLLRSDEVRELATINAVRNVLSLPKLTEYDDTYMLRYGVVTAAVATATTLVLTGYTDLLSGDMLIITDKETGVKQYTSLTATPTTTSVSVSAVDNDVAVGSIIEVRKNPIPKNYIIGRTSQKSQIIASLPSAINGFPSAMRPGRFAITATSPWQDEANFRVTGGYHGGPVIWMPGGFFAVRVA